jgi:hypothetical protein
VVEFGFSIAFLPSTMTTSRINSFLLMLARKYFAQARENRDDQSTLKYLTDGQVEMRFPKQKISSSFIDLTAH